MTTTQTAFSIIYSCLYYLVFPLQILLKWLLIALGVIGAPLLHLAHYILHACLWPLRFLARFETLYIFFGVATLVGAVMGLILHLSSSIVLTTLKLDAGTEEHGRTLASYRAEKQRKQEQKAKQRMPRVGDYRTTDRSLSGQYTDWLEKDGGQGKKGLLSTTILEENDDSDLDF